VSDKATNREEIYVAIYGQVSKVLHPLVSQYDQSESNLRMQFNHNPYFVNACKCITHLLMELNYDPNEKALTPQDIDMMLRFGTPR